MPTLTYDIGYYGKAYIDNTTDGSSKIAVLATGGSFSVEYSPIFTTGVWGADISNVTEKVAYAPNYVSVSANVNFQLTSGVAQKIQAIAFGSRAGQDGKSGHYFQILPNGIAGYKGRGFCISLSLSTSQDALVTGDIGFKSGTVKATSGGGTINIGSASSHQSSTLNTSVPNYTDVYPYWASTVYLSNEDEDKDGAVTRPNKPLLPSPVLSGVTDWNASYSSDLTLVGCCANGQSDSTLTDDGYKIQANYCALGAMDATGSFTLLGAKKYLIAQEIQKCHGCGMTMNTAYGVSSSNSKATQCKIKYAKIVWTGVNMDMQSGNSMIQTSCNFTGLGIDTAAPMAFSYGPESN